MATMKKTMVFVSLLALFVVLAACSGARFHEKELPTPTTYQAHFPDMDYDGNESVTWNEFHKYFPQATTDVFEALDRNQDKAVDHDEWHEFKEAHGLKSHH
jgi:predicted PolB exonuclease-like 3'-5' exonuclease